MVETYIRPSRAADLETEITLLPSERGGKRVPVQSGYRTVHDFHLPDTLIDAQHEYVENHQLQPGQTGRALLWLLTPELQRGRLFAGFSFTVQEGNRIVGEGKVLRVLNPELQRIV